MADKSFRSSLPDGGEADTEFMLFMVGLVLVGGLGFASAIYPIIETVIILLLVAIGVTGIILVVRHVRKERRLDWEAFHGPINEEEKENT